MNGLLEHKGLKDTAKIQELYKNINSLTLELENERIRFKEIQKTVYTNMREKLDQC